MKQFERKCRVCGGTFLEDDDEQGFPCVGVCWHCFCDDYPLLAGTEFTLKPAVEGERAWLGPTTLPEPKRL